MIALILLTALALPYPPGFHKPLYSPKDTEFRASVRSGSLPVSPGQKVIPSSTIQPGFVITNLSLTSTSVTVAWQNGTPPFQVQGTPAFGLPWVNIGAPTTARTKTFPIDQTHFYRVQGNIVMPLTATHTNPNTLVWTVPDIDMSDSLSLFHLDRTAQSSPAFDPASNSGWDSVDYVNPSTVISPWTDPGSPSGQITYRVRQTTVGGVTLPFSLLPINVTPGQMQWAKTYQGSTLAPGSSFPYSIVSDRLVASPQGDLLIGGLYGNLGGGGWGLWLADKTGTLLWSQVYGPNTGTGGQGAQAIRGVCIAPDGFIYAVGYFSGTFNLGNGVVITANGSADLFVAKFSYNRTTGPTALWAKSWGSTVTTDAPNYYESGYSVTTDAAGNNVFVTGGFLGTVNFGGGNRTCSGVSGLVTLKLSASDGSYQWDSAYAGSSSVLGFGVTVDFSGNAFVTGRFLGTIGSTASKNSGNYSGFLLKLSGTDGSLSWVNSLGSTSGICEGHGVTLDGNGNPIITGFFQASNSDLADFGNGHTMIGPQWTGPVLRDAIFVAKYQSSNGSWMWSTPIGGHYSDRGFCISQFGSGSNDRVAVGGWITGDTRVGAKQYNTPNFNTDAVLFVLDSGSGSTFSWSQSYGNTTYQEEVDCICFDINGFIVSSGQQIGDITLPDGTTLPDSSGVQDICTIKFSP